MDYKPFLTGSQAYGEPSDESDIDLVVLMPPELAEVLQTLSGLSCGCGYGEDPSTNLRFGKLNLIAVHSPSVYEMWRKGTDDCVNESKQLGRPITREEAISFITNRFLEAT